MKLEIKKKNKLQDKTLAGWEISSPSILYQGIKAIRICAFQMFLAGENRRGNYMGTNRKGTELFVVHKLQIKNEKEWVYITIYIYVYINIYII